MSSPRGSLHSVDQYLGKIFQIPFWLRPLTFAADGVDGSHERLLASLVGTKAEPAETGLTTAPEPTEKPPSQPLPISLEGGPTIARTSEEKAQEVEPADSDGLQKNESATRPAETAHALTYQAVTLVDSEIRLLNALGPIAGTSPRAIKRMVNIYRLLRARRNARELRRLLGEDGYAPDYPAVMLILAIGTGLRAFQAYELLQKLLARPSYEQNVDHGINPDRLRLLLQPAELNDLDRDSFELSSDLKEVLGLEAERVRIGLVSADAATPSGSYNEQSLRRAVAEVARFMFKPPVAVLVKADPKNSVT